MFRLMNKVWEEEKGKEEKEEEALSYNKNRKRFRCQKEVDLKLHLTARPARRKKSWLLFWKACLWSFIIKLIWGHTNHHNLYYITNIYNYMEPLANNISLIIYNTFDVLYNNTETITTNI